MSSSLNYLAFDLGASNGRALLGRFDGATLQLEELHRFPNGPVAVRGRLYWDAFALFEQIRRAIGLCTNRGVPLDALGIDTWGVDFALLGARRELLEMPRHYRDSRTDGVMQRVFERVPRAEIYRRTGIQFMALNTLYQLFAAAAESPRLLAAADRLLFMPDLLAFWLTGVDRSERSIASTSQMLSPRSGEWDEELLGKLDLPARILPEVQPTGTLCGPLSGEIADEVGQAGAPLIHTACHDTASAVVAVPGRGDDWAYISSGTWSIVGVERDDPLITDEGLAANFTNEAGAAGTIRFLKNVPGLWLLQECQRTWAAQGAPSRYEELLPAADAAPQLASLVHTEDPRFMQPGDMPARIRQACREAGQPEPRSPGEVTRCVLESLALTYRREFAVLERLIGRPIRTIHVVGGGSQNPLLNQLTADATGRPVVAGPAEATAIGNLLVQLLAQGRACTLAELRAIVSRSVSLKRYEPRQHEAWEQAESRMARPR
ncbi:MAG: rhamnulokinase [Phycisphaerae bacterium]|jgi:rhamnulokinase